MVRGLAVPVLLAVPAAGLVALAPAMPALHAEPEPVPEPTRTLVGAVWTIDTENSSFVLRDEAEAHHTVRTTDRTEYFLGEAEAERSEVIVLDAKVTAVLVGTGESEAASRVTREPPGPGSALGG